MSKLKKPISFETTFGKYEVDELLGEGGAGRVYGGVDFDRQPVAVKVLAQERATSDKRKRFKNEVAFLVRSKHTNIVSVTDNGINLAGDVVGPFYVMPRYDGSLRDLMAKGIAPERVLQLFSQILDGVEAAHLHGVIHRDLKPENVLYDKKTDKLAVADFGTARFTEELVATVETDPGQRLANFQYAAPEQRRPGSPISATADIYALGLILNEMFTRAVPQGTDFLLVARVAPDFGFLDESIARMLRQSPDERPGSIADVKALIERYRSEAVAHQRISKIDGTVIKATDVDEPLAETPPKLISCDWSAGTLTLIMDRPVTPQWIDALYRMGSYSSVFGKPPEVFSFRGDRATVSAAEHEVQSVIDCFKTWLPTASRTLKSLLEEAARRDAAAKREQLRREREAEEQRLRVLSRVKI